MKSISDRTRWIKQQALALGFDACGISKADFLQDDAPRLEKWLKENMHGQMHYMANHFDKRLDPRLLVPDSKSVVSLLFNYFPEPSQSSNTDYKISKYAYGNDYHEVIKEKLKAFLQAINDNIGEVSGRCFVDSAPVLERSWAQKGGLGWVGKNGNLINKKSGSFYFLAELIIDMELEPDGPATDHCGTCTKCIDACPTQAIVGPQIVDGSKCISYFTIEMKSEIPADAPQWKNWIFGCDICQDVCPWNRFSKPHINNELLSNTQVQNWQPEQWQELTEEIFEFFFKNSPLKRRGYHGLLANIKHIS